MTSPPSADSRNEQLFISYRRAPVRSSANAANTPCRNAKHDLCLRPAEQWTVDENRQPQRRKLDCTLPYRKARGLGLDRHNVRDKDRLLGRFAARLRLMTSAGVRLLA